jgi:hypothetical protein
MIARVIRTLAARAASGFVLCVMLVAQQPNSPAAAAVWNGIDGPPWPVMVTATPSGGVLSFVVAGAPNQGFLLALAPAGVSATGLPTSVGLVDLDVSSGLAFVLDGLFGNTSTGLEAFATTGPTGVVTWGIPFPSCGTVHFGALQVLVADPASPAGFTATAATDLTVTSPVTSAVYVSATTGASGAPGTQGMPVATIAEGIALALASGFPHPAVRVAIGIYAEAPSFPQLVCVTGGLDPTTWAPIPGMRSLVDTGQGTASATYVLAPTVISSLEFSAQSAVAPNLSSIAFRVQGGTGLLRFENCRFVAHDGGPGAAGASGQAGASGSAGGDAIPFFAGTIPGPGGTGPWPGGGGGGSDQAGQPGGFGGGPGGPTGAFCGAAGGPGGNGPNGADGPNGAPAAPGSIQGGTWTSSFAGNGTAGLNGLGGGGGGGGHHGGLAGSSCIGASGGGGGGGGAGGDGGQPGLGGQGGGASLGLLVVDGAVVLSACEFACGVGGAGGAGGNGGAAGAGGPGGTGGFGQFGGIAGGFGGAGAAGGSGGGGGGGAGGAGGPSFGIYRAGAANPMLISPMFTWIAGGPGGAGGLHGTFGAQSAPQGAPGAYGSIGS